MSEQNNSDQTESIQSKMKRLDEYVEWFHGSEFVLEEAFERYEVAERLAGQIQSQLDSMKNTINVLKKRFDHESA